MIILKYILCFAATFTFLSCTGAGSANNSVTEIKKETTVADTPEANQYAVYDALISDNSLGIIDLGKVSIIVIKERTDKYYRDDSKMLERVLVNVQKQLPSLSKATLDDFRAKNQNRVLLKDSFTSPLKRVFINDEEIAAIFKHELDWEAFYKKYPNSQGILTLSNVGFDAGMKQAFVYAANTRGSLDAVGLYVVLEKQNGVWRVKGKDAAWMS